MQKKTLYRAIHYAFPIAIALNTVGCKQDSTYLNSADEIYNTGLTLTDEQADSKANLMLDQMTLEQKIQLVHGHGQPSWRKSYSFINYPLPETDIDEAVGFIPGIKSLGIPDIIMADAAAGVNAEGKNATGLPSPINLAATWDTELSRKYGSRIAKEAKNLGFNTVLGGGVNLVRDPRSGRGFEYMGEDPILSGELGAYRTIGAQSNQMMATIKHFAMNNIETDRFISNSIVDEQTMRETELLAFEIAITKGKPAYVMCAYNQVNGVYACENDYLLNDVLKKEWGFKGMVVSDWGATSTTINAANNGLDEEQPGQMTEDTEMPDSMKILFGGPYFINKLSDSIDSGAVPVERLNNMVFRKLRTMFSTGVMFNTSKVGKINESEGNADALEIAKNSIVLLKNEAPNDSDSPILPLGSDIKKIAVIGFHADAGVLTGGGSGGSHPLIENGVSDCGDGLYGWFSECPVFLGEAPLNAIRNEFPNASISFAKGDDLTEATRIAKDADVAIVFAGSWYVEGSDRVDMGLQRHDTDSTGVFTYDQDELIAQVSSNNEKTIVILEAGGPVKMPWIQDIEGLFNVGYPGVKGATAIAKVLSGEYNPSGKLPVTFPKSEADLPMPELPFNIAETFRTGIALKNMSYIYEDVLGKDAYDSLRSITYSEKLNLGYKWYDVNNIEPLFRFGYGLSYTTFSYSNPTIDIEAQDNLTITFDIKNTGDVKGKDIVQVYVSLPENIPGNEQPPQKLVGWVSENLEPKETKTVTVNIPKKYISTWDIESSSWITTPGVYSFRIGKDSNMNSESSIYTNIQINK